MRNDAFIAKMVLCAGSAYIAPMNEPAPIKSDFATAEEAAAYDAWFKAKVEASLADDRPPVSHEEAMARARAVIDRHRRRGKAC